MIYKCLTYIQKLFDVLLEKCGLPLFIYLDHARPFSSLKITEIFTSCGVEVCRMSSVFMKKTRAERGLRSLGGVPLGPEGSLMHSAHDFKLGGSYDR